MASRSHSPPLLISDPNKLLRRQDSSNSVLIDNHSDVLMPCSMSSTKKSMVQDFYSTFIQSNIHPQLQLLQHHAPMNLQVPINMYPAPSPITCMQGLNMENSFMTQNSDQCIDKQLLSRTAPPAASHDHEKRPAPLRITHNTPISVSQEEEKSCNAVDISVTASKKRSRTSFGSCKLARDVDDEKRGIKRTKSGDSAVTSEANMSSSTTARRDTQAPCDSPPNMILPKNKKSLNQVAKNFNNNNNNNNNKNMKIDERAPTNDKSCDSDNAPTNCNNKADFIHVRARRGQATDSHSLAERVRREKISERMKYLQDLVPGCVKVTGKAMMLDEIINYVQSLQKQVEFLSMKLATVPPSQLEFSLENLFGKKEEVQPNILNDDGNSRQPYSPSAIVEKGNHTQDLRNLMSFKDENLGDDSQRHQLSPIAMSRVSDLLQAASLQLPCSSSDFMANLLADNTGFPDRTDTYTLGGNASNGAGLGFISDASCLPHADITPASGLAEWDDELQDMAQQLGLSAGYPLFAPQLLNEGSFF